MKTMRSLSIPVTLGEYLQTILEWPVLMLGFSFKKTKSMSALLKERSTRKNVRGDATHTSARTSKSGTPQSLTSLVESVKRRNMVTLNDGDTKRQKL